MSWLVVGYCNVASILRHLPPILRSSISRKSANRVAGGFSPPAPTTPRMRVRAGRFRRFSKDSVMDDFKAGFETGRRNRFTRSGAIRMPRSVRLSLCRRFGPSPCPAHYGGRLTTTPSADFCSLTHARRCRQARCPSHGRVRWCVQSFRAGPQSDSPSGTGRSGTDLPG